MTVGDSTVNPVQHLPEHVTHVKKETIKAFPHSKRVGGYLLGQTLGVGSFAKVKEGLHLVTGEKVAVKIIDKKRAKTDNYVRKNLRREGKLLQLIRHPNVVSLLEVMETDNSYYLVTEMCRGGDLMEYISAKKRLPEAEVATFIRQIISAVDYLHRMGIIHRDLKIENLLLDENKNIKLIDFGLSNFIKVADSPEGTQAQEFCVTQCGSPAYAAPELLNHEKYGLQVDLWSIGVNMYAMLTGGLPFTVEPFNIKALYAKMKDRQMNPLPDTLSRGKQPMMSNCRDLLLKFLTPDPSKRVTIAEALNHPWIMQGNKPLSRHPCPNRMRASDLDADILSHMSDNLNFRMAEVIKFVTSNIPSSACATYHLYHEKLQRYNADMRSRGLVPTSATSRSVKDSQIIFHLQDMWTDVSKEQPPPVSVPNDDLSSMKTPVGNLGNTDINVTTSSTNIKSETRTSAERRNKDLSTDRKVSRNSTFRYNMMKFNSDEICDQPSPDITLLNNNPSPAAPRHTPQTGREVLPLVKSSLELTMPKNIGQMSTENICTAKLIHNRKATDKNDTESMKDKFNFAYIQFQSKKTVSSPREFQYPSRQVKHEAINLISEENLCYNSEVTHDSKLKFNSMNSELYHNNSLLKDNISNLENVQPNQSRRYIQNNRLLSRRGVIKTIDLNASSIPDDKNNVSPLNGGNQNCKLVRHASPAANKTTPKQIKPFHSAHERPKLSETCPPHFLKQSQKAKCSESMILHGKNLLNTAHSIDFTSPPKSSTSPPLKPAVVRRKLAKRHRINESTPSGNIIQDQVITTDLLESDTADLKSGTEENGRLTSSLPSISPHISR